METFIVGQVGCWPLTEGLAVEVLEDLLVSFQGTLRPIAVRSRSLE